MIEISYTDSKPYTPKWEDTPRVHIFSIQDELNLEILSKVTQTVQCMIIKAYYDAGHNYLMSFIAQETPHNLQADIANKMKDLINKGELIFDEPSNSWYCPGIDSPPMPEAIREKAEESMRQERKEEEEKRATQAYEDRKTRLQKRYGEKEGSFLAARIAKVHRSNTDGCKDNERIALESVRSEMRQYKEQQHSGCCGADDNVFEFTDHETGLVKRFHYGFNYGH